MNIKLKGKAKYIDLSGGFWGIIGNDGKEYRAINMPEQFKEEACEVHCLAEIVDLDFDIFMWGIPIRIISFKTS
jgi:hypothetical protein